MAERNQEIVEIPIQNILEAKLLKRTEGYEDQDFIELSASIKKMGVIEPIIVVKEGKKYRVIAGMRRLMASSVAGLVTVPGVVKKLSKAQQIKIRWMENENRKNIGAYERAEFIRELMKEMSWSQSDVAKHLLKSEGFVSQHIGILKGYEIVRELLEAGRISFSVARELNRAKNEGIAEMLSSYAKDNNAGDKQVRLWVQNENSKKDIEKTEDGEDEPQESYENKEAMELCDVCGEGKYVKEIRWIKVCNGCRRIIDEGGA